MKDYDDSTGLDRAWRDALIALIAILSLPIIALLGVLELFQAIFRKR